MITAIRILSVLSVLLCGVSAAQAETHRFSIYAAGIKAGSVTITADLSATRYRLTGSVRPLGMFQTVSRFAYDGRVSGAVKGGRLIPLSYSEKTVAGDRTSEVKMVYRNGRPEVTQYTGTSDTGVSASGQGGALDLLTAGYILFRTVSAAQLCNQTLRMFDGKRATKLVIQRPKGAGPTTCAGTYHRVAGFSAKSMKKGSNFPFTLTYRKVQDGRYQLQSFKTKTTFGFATVERN